MHNICTFIYVYICFLRRTPIYSEKGILQVCGLGGSDFFLMMLATSWVANSKAVEKIICSPLNCSNKQVRLYKTYSHAYLQLYITLRTVL